jgi:hypothetical protein
MAKCLIDHLVITSPSLEKGAAFIQHMLGVTPQAGGEHPRMGTHNLLLSLGDSMYLEILAANPKAPAIGRPRWFELDSLPVDAQPGLSTWVVRTTDIKAKTQTCSESLGNIEPMSRGSLNWLLTVTDDGSLPLDGVAPALIEWHTDGHPAAKLEDAGLSLIKLEIFHPDPDRVRRMLVSIDLDGPFLVSASASDTSAYLTAQVSTPQGLRQLSAPGRNTL